MSKHIPPEAKKVFEGVIFDVYQWEQEGYDGKKRTFEMLDRPDTSLIIPVTEDKKIIIAKQEQPGKPPFVGLVGGRVDEGEDALTAAKRELLEEGGYESQDWELFDAVQPVSKIDWTVCAYIARGCQKIAEQNLDGAEKVELLFLTFDEFLEMVVNNGQFRDAELKMKLMEVKLDPTKMLKLKKQLGLK